MSINDAMLAGVTGLIANSSALSAISDNIANSQTVGYKDTHVDFSTLVTGQANAGSVSAGGVTAVANQDVTQQGQLQATNSPTDLAVSGNGFFVTTQSASSPTSTTPVMYTRAGSFTANDQGYLVNSAGLYLQGWPVDNNGKVQSDPTNLTKLQPINITAIVGAAEPTTQVSLNANILATQTVSEAALAAAGVAGATAPPYDPTSATASMAATVLPNGKPAPSGTGTQPDFSIPITISDAKGAQQNFELDLLKSNTPNQWYAELVANPPDSVQTTGVPQGQVAAGIIAFTPTGAFDPTSTTFLVPAGQPAGTTLSTYYGSAGNPPADETPTLSIGASTGTPAATGDVNWAQNLGDASQNVTINLAALTQFDSPSTVQSIAANGSVFGNLSNVEVSSTGAVTAVFDNGVTREVAQVALATVPNPDGMTALPGNAYTISNQSGSATLKTPGSGGAGTISPNSLESSTVDLSTQFTNLITTQQAYAAASKIITTANQMLTTLINAVQ